MSRTAKVREIYALLCARVPEGAMSHLDLLASAAALVDLHEAPANDGGWSDIEGGRPMAEWAMDIMFRRRPARLVREQRMFTAGAFEEEETRHEAAYMIARSMMEYGL